jgi:hypothetical protein
MVFRGFSRRLASGRRSFPVSAPLRRHFSSKALLKIVGGHQETSFIGHLPV